MISSPSHGLATSRQPGLRPRHCGCSTRQLVKFCLCRRRSGRLTASRVADSLAAVSRHHCQSKKRAEKSSQMAPDGYKPPIERYSRRAKTDCYLDLSTFRLWPMANVRACIAVTLRIYLPFGPLGGASLQRRQPPWFFQRRPPIDLRHQTALGLVPHSIEGVLDVPGAGFGYRNFRCSRVRRAFVGLVGREHARLS
jgi:hypothetical protein